MSENKSEIVWLPTQTLLVDSDYQRRVSQSKVSKMAKNWHPQSVGVIVVSLRADGRYYVIDGQHRVAAAKKIGITELRCEVHKDLPIQTEAKTFHYNNANRKSPNRIELFNALRIEGDPAVALVDRLVASVGRHVGEGKSTATNIRCAGALHEFALNYPETLERVWPLLAELCKGEVLDERLVRAFHYLEPRIAPRSLTEATIAKRLIRMGYRKVLGFINQSAAAYARGGDRPWALGLLNAANFGVSEKHELRIKDREASLV
jgi:hypothetical protein